MLSVSLMANVLGFSLSASPTSVALSSNHPISPLLMTSSCMFLTQLMLSTGRAFPAGCATPGHYVEGFSSFRQGLCVVVFIAGWQWAISEAALYPSSKILLMSLPFPEFLLVSG